MTTLIAPLRQSPPSAPIEPLPGAAARALHAAVEALFSKQRPDGHWCAELEGDSILSSEYLLMKAILGQRTPGDAEWSEKLDDAARLEKMCAYLRWLQRPDGTWGQYPGAQADLSACVKAYFALKIFGDDSRAPHMQRAREAILSRGGAERLNTFSMFYLACLGQVEWTACPAIPPEIVFLPRWFPFHMDKVAAWTRTMILPLALCTALRPVRALPDHLGIPELFVDERGKRTLNQPWDAREPASWTNFFLSIDRGLKWAHHLGGSPIRGGAIRAAREWIVARMTSRTTDGLGAIFPPMVYIQVALQALGDARHSPVRATAEKELDRFIVERDDHIRIQPCFSPVWDTGIALYALTEAGRDCRNDARIRRCCEWLLDREVNMVGDWVRNLRPRDRASFESAPAAGEHKPWAAWAFEYRNDWYPDVDDTAMVAKALRRAAEGFAGRAGASVESTSHAAASDAAARAVRWIRAMQNDDGGWAAFDRTRDRPWMEEIPFADHNAMQDPSCPDITGRTVEALITCGVDREDSMIRSAVNYILRSQRDDGSWIGRWGVNYLYGTWQAAGGLHAAGEDMSRPALARTLAWLRRMQNPDGGFGETADSYIDPALKGRGPSTASQTSWGALTLMYLTSPRDHAISRAIRWLCDHQLSADAPASAQPAPLRDAAPGGFIEAHPAPRGNHLLDEPAGSWREPWFTGTGFPKVFYLRYHLYRHYFPVMALARWIRLSQRITPLRTSAQVRA